MKKFIVELDDDSCCYFQNPVYHVCRVTGNFCNVDRICERAGALSDEGGERR